MKALCKTCLAMVAIAALMVGGDGVLTGCTTSNDGTLGEPAFNITASKREALVGENVTFTTRSKNLAGRESHIEWRSSGGELTTEENNRVARVKFDRPGKYTISSRLYVDGQAVETDSVSVDVRPIH